MRLFVCYSSFLHTAKVDERTRFARGATLRVAAVRKGGAVGGHELQRRLAMRGLVRQPAGVQHELKANVNASVATAARRTAGTAMDVGCVCRGRIEIHKVIDELTGTDVADGVRPFANFPINDFREQAEALGLIAAANADVVVRGSIEIPFCVLGARFCVRVSLQPS